MLEVDRKEGVIDRRVFFDCRVFDEKGFASSSDVRRIRAGMDSKSVLICFWSCSSLLAFLGLDSGAGDKSISSNRGGSSGVRGPVGSDGENGGLCCMFDEGRWDIAGARGESGGL
jgi:hypothetical protein